MMLPIEINHASYHKDTEDLNHQKQNLTFLNQFPSDYSNLFPKTYKIHKIKEKKEKTYRSLFHFSIKQHEYIQDNLSSKLVRQQYKAIPYKAIPLHSEPEIPPESISVVWELIMKGGAHILYESLKPELPNHEPVSVEESQTKTTETLCTEFILFDMLDHFEDYEIVFHLFQAFIKYKGIHLCDPESGQWLELKQLVTKTNFNQISFNSEQLQKASLLLKLECLTVSEFARMTKIEADFLTDLEKGLIHDYSRNGYIYYNRFLQGRFFSLADKMPCCSYSLKLWFLKSAILVSALNKLPDYVNLQHPFLYRMEKDPPPEVIEKRIRAVKAGGLTTPPFGVTSTSAEKPESAWSSRRVVIIYLNAKGKNIRHFSAMPEEREVVLPPVHIRWLYHMSITVNTVKKDIFFAKPVSQPISDPKINEPLLTKK